MTDFRLADRMSRLGTESAFEVLARAKAMEAAGHKIIHLEIGEPDFPTAVHIVEAAVEALRAGHTHYVPAPGIPLLREAVAAFLERTGRMRTTPDRVVVTPGAKPIMFFTILALANEGDEVLYPDPGFPMYESITSFAGAVPDDDFVEVPELPQPASASVSATAGAIVPSRPTPVRLRITHPLELAPLVPAPWSRPPTWPSGRTAGPDILGAARTRAHRGPARDRGRPAPFPQLVLVEPVGEVAERQPGLRVGPGDLPTRTVVPERARRDRLAQAARTGSPVVAGRRAAIRRAQAASAMIAGAAAVIVQSAAVAGALAAVLLHAAGHERLMGRPCSPRQHLQRHLSARTPEHRRLHQAPRRLAVRQRSQSRASMQGKAPQSPATFSSGFSPFRMQGRRRNAAAKVQKDGRARALPR